MRTFLVTGGAGFIGSHIAEALVRRHDKVRVLDNLSTGHLSNLDPIRDQVEFVEGDLLDTETVERVVDGVDCIFHQAALASVPRSVKNPLATNAACVTGTLTLLDAARNAKPTCRARFPPMRSRNSPENTTAEHSPPPTSSKRLPSATSTCSDHGRTPTAPTRP